MEPERNEDHAYVLLPRSQAGTYLRFRIMCKGLHE